MPDDTVRNVTISVPSAPVEGHPHGVSVVPRRRRRREENEEKNGERGPVAVEDKVTLSTDFGREAKEEEEGETQGEKEEKAPRPRIDIRV